MLCKILDVLICTLRAVKKRTLWDVEKSHVSMCDVCYIYNCLYTRYCWKIFLIVNDNLHFTVMRKCDNMRVGKSLWADKSLSAWTTNVREERDYTNESMDLTKLWSSLWQLKWMDGVQVFVKFWVDRNFKLHYGSRYVESQTVNFKINLKSEKMHLKRKYFAYKILSYKINERLVKNYKSLSFSNWLKQTKNKSSLRPNFNKYLKL